MKIVQNDLIIYFFDEELGIEHLDDAFEAFDMIVMCASDPLLPTAFMKQAQ